MTTKQTWKASIDFKFIRDNKEAISANIHNRKSAGDVEQVVQLYEQSVNLSQVLVISGKVVGISRTLSVSIQELASCSRAQFPCQFRNGRDTQIESMYRILCRHCSISTLLSLFQLMRSVGREGSLSM